MFMTIVYKNCYILIKTIGNKESIVIKYPNGEYETVKSIHAAKWIITRTYNKTNPFRD
jgi:hypothetical protein